MDRDISDSDGGGGGGGGGEGHSQLPSDSPPREPLSGGGGFRPMRGGESDSDHQKLLFGQKRRSLVFHMTLHQEPVLQDFPKELRDSVPTNVDTLNPYVLRDIYEINWQSSSAVHANKCIIRLLPKLEDLLKADFDWAHLFDHFPYMHDL